MIKNLYLIRHGQSMQNKAANCFSGSTDVSISEKGRQQAAELSGFFRDIAIVSHATSIRMFVTKVLGLPLRYFRRIPCDNCSVTKFQ